MSADQAWTRFRGFSNCAFAWAATKTFGDARYAMRCLDGPPSDGFTDAQKTYVKCEAAVLFTAGVTLAAGGAGALVFGAGSGGCSLNFLFEHFLGW